VSRLRAARGRLSSCPKGSKVGSGAATATAVALGITSSGRLTLFNGPGGRTFTINVRVTNPAAIDATFSARFLRLGGRYVLKLATKIPDSLKTVLGSDIVIKKLDVTTGATYVVDGVRRGYFEAQRCPASGSAVHGDFAFGGGAEASAHTTVAC
jgi:uncharacterized protein (DUF58 family)